MLDSVGTFLRNLIQDVRFADVVDIVLVATFLYALMTWFQQSTSRGTTRRTLTVALIVGAVYVLARVFELYLTEMLIKLLLLLIVLTMVVVFQADIRRFVDRLGMLGMQSNDAQGQDTATINSLTEAVGHMAETQTGALIAIKGDEPWDRLTEGGIAMGGRVTQVLLRSLFNPTSPGHDGAILLDGNTITRFAVHLPLSPNKDAVGPHGTRHAAALGLAEQCDAFVIVVSEESGQISVAEGGRLIPMDSVTDLRERLERFWNQHYAEGTEHPSWWRRRSVRRALLALGLAALLWGFFAHRPETVHRVFEVPVELRNLDERWNLQNEVPSTARVTLAGSEQAFRLMDPSNLALSLNMEDLEEGPNEFIYSAENLNLPANISIYSIDPREVDVLAQEMQSVEVPVEVRTNRPIPDSLELADVQPETVMVLIPQDSDPPAQMFTKTISLDLDGMSEEMTIQTQLDLPSDLRLPPDQDAQVTIRIRKKQPQETP